MFDTLIDKYRPAAQEVGQQALAQVERIVGRLDMIHDALSREEARDIRKRYVSTPAQNATVLFFEVPANQLWELEYINCYSATGALQFLVDNPSAGSPPFFSAQVPAGGQAFLNVGLFLPGGTQVYAFGAGTSQLITAQVRVNPPVRQARDTNAVGVPEIGTGGVPSPQAELEEADRHGQPNVVMMPNIIGERHNG